MSKLADLFCTACAWCATPALRLSMQSMALYAHIPFSRTARFIVLASAALLFQSAVNAANVRLSFLRDKVALRETLDLLTNGGFTLRGAMAFGEAVHRYNLCASDLDFSRFPALQDGFYRFGSVRDVAAALPKRLCETEHNYDLNCFDALLLVAGDKLRSALAPDRITGPFMVENITTNGESFALAATSRDAFTLIYAAWYREQTADLFPESMRDLRICFTPALARCHVLPTSIRTDAVGTQVLAVLRTNWRREDIEFPKAFEIVLLHKVSLSRHLCNTIHAGLLLQRGKGYTYLEKAGGKGPFVRLDVEKRDDLLPWLAQIFTAEDRLNVDLLATFNDTGVEKLNSK